MPPIEPLIELKIKMSWITMEEENDIVLIEPYQKDENMPLIELKNKMSWITREENDIVLIEPYLRNKISAMAELTPLQKQLVLQQCLKEIYGKQQHS